MLGGGLGSLGPIRDTSVVVVWMMENPSEVCGAGNGEERMEVRDVLKGELIRAEDRSWGRSTGEVKNDGCLAAN